MSPAVRVRDPPHPAGRPGLKAFVVLSILFSVLAGRGPLPVALAQTQTPNDSVVDQWLHELYSVFGIGPGGSRTLVPTSTATSTASASASSSSTQARNQTQKAPSERQGGDGSGSAHGATPDGPASSTNGTSTSNGTSSRDHGRAVFANFVVRNTEKYTVDCWMEGALRHPSHLKEVRLTTNRDQARCIGRLRRARAQHRVRALGSETGRERLLCCIEGQQRQ